MQTLEISRPYYILQFYNVLIIIMRHRRKSLAKLVQRKQLLKSLNLS